jgi:hypothetical protein
VIDPDQGTVELIDEAAGQGDGPLGQVALLGQVAQGEAGGILPVGRPQFRRYAGVVDRGPRAPAVGTEEVAAGQREAEYSRRVSD